VATHYSELKAFAHATPGVANASMEFDVATLSPTYRLLIGLPGASNAFTIAQRLGLSVDIINRARGLVSEDAQQIEAMLAEIKAQTEAAQRVRHQAEAEREEAEKQTQQLQRRLAEIDVERRDILNAAREDARREIKAVREEIRTLKEQALAEIKARVESTPDIVFEEQLGQLEAQVEARVERETKTKAKTTSDHRPPTPGPIALGDKVFIPQLNTVGEVVGMQNKQVEVQLGAFRSTVPLTGLVLREKAAPRELEATQSSVKIPTVESPGMELDLRGQIAAEALLHLDQYLDQAFLARLPWVRIIHGKGSGALRQAVRQELNEHPMVSSYRPGDESEGGEGVTVAKLALN
jgi:DNA mismatch repair protein MutS2